MKSAKDVELAIDQAGDNVAADADSEDEQEPKAKFVKFSKDKEEEVLEEDLQYSKKEVHISDEFNNKFFLLLLTL